MTRFARAKGSKASNERVHEESTPWEVMKQQLDQKKQEVFDAQKRKEAEEKRKENYKAFLEERENDVKTEWAEFEGTSKKQDKVKKKKKNKIDSENDENPPQLQELISKIEKILDKDDNVRQPHKMKNKNIPIENNDNDNDAPEESSAKIVPSKPKIKIIVPKKVPLKIPSLNKQLDNKTAEDDRVQIKNDKVLETDKKAKKRKHTEDPNNDNTKKLKKSMDNDKVVDEVKKSKKHKLTLGGNAQMSINDNKKKKNKINEDTNNNTGKNEKRKLEDMTEDEIKRMNKKKAKRMRQLESRKKFKAEQKEIALREAENQNNPKQKLPKKRDNKEHQKRKPNSEIKTMDINGVAVEIDYYDGFPIKKDDAKRLHNLRKEMISKGIPRGEVQIALKLERRKAEKALARERKKVCFNCRKSGHILAECPDLNENSTQEITGTGICFKCGSTEHTHFDCKVIKKDNFKFATCFICREQGHISRQCPDNQKGLYPKGGSCRVCGDVTHMMKDCPKYRASQDSQTIELDTLEFSNVESLPEEKRKNNKLNNSKTNKIVKF